MTDRAFILANLHLHAVLPRLEDLVEFDEEARSIAREMQLRVRFRVRKGPSRIVEISEGVVRTSSNPQTKAGLGLFFASCDQLNNLFMEKRAIPIPYRGLMQLRQMSRFSKLTEILTRYLKPAESDLKDPEFKRKHVEMMLQTGLAGAAQIAKYDSKVEHAVDLLPHGSIQFSVLPDGPFAFVEVDEEKNISSGSGKIDNPSANLDINGLDIAADLLADRLDQFAALGSGDLRASGLLPLVDEFNAVLDRVGKYLA